MRILRGDDALRTPGQQAAASAIRRIEDAQEAAERRQSEVSRQAGLMRRLQRDNHFAEKFERALRGGHT
jgi:hypothetical protein